MPYRFKEHALEVAGQIASEYAAKKPHMVPYDLSTFDGCSGVPDTARACCFVHDLEYFYAETSDERRKADREFRICIISLAENETDPWSKAAWFVRGWVFWAAVRAFGWRAVSKHKRARHPLSVNDP
jgi:hypothetical protein